MKLTWINNVPPFKFIILLFAYAILFAGVFFHGIYLPNEFLIMNILIGFLTIISIFFNGKYFKNYAINEIDLLAFLIGGIYTLAVFGSANVNMAINQALRIWAYIAYYLILSRMFTKNNYKILFIKGIILLGVLNTLFGLLTVTGLVEYNLSWTDVLSSTFQYHNAFATFIIPLIIFAGYFSISTSDLRWKVFYQVAAFIMSLGLAGSQSRGGYLVFFSAVLLLYFGFGIKHKFKFIGFLATIITGFVLWDRFLSAVKGSSFTGVFLWLLLGLALTVFYTIFIMQDGKRHLINLPRKKALTMTLIFIVLAFGVLYFLKSNGDVINRIKNINIHDHSVEERFVFYSDALKMVKDSPLLGFGGGGWTAAYEKYQSYLYFSTEVHSDLLNVMVETGVLGFLVYIAFIITVLRTLIKNRKYFLKLKSPNTEFNTVTGITFISIIIHALIDFNLSKGAVSLLLWTIIAIIRSVHADLKSEIVNIDSLQTNNATTSKAKKREIQEASNETRKNAIYSLYAFTLIGIGLVLLPTLIMMSGNQVAQAIKAEKAGNHLDAADLYRTATKLYPFDSRTWSDLASIDAILAIQMTDTKKAEEAKAEIEKAINLNRYDPNVETAAVGTLSRLGDYERAYQLAEATINLAPFHNEVYESFGQAALNYSMYFARNKDMKNARSKALDVLSIQKIIKQKLTDLSPLYKRNWVVPQKLNITPDMNLHEAEAKIILGDDDGVKELTLLSNNKQVGLEAKTWLMAVAMVDENKLLKDKLSSELTRKDVMNSQLLVPFIRILK